MMSVYNTFPLFFFSLPCFQGLSNVNSCTLSASFVLVLPQPIPVAMSNVNAIQSVTGRTCVTVMTCVTGMTYVTGMTRVTGMTHVPGIEIVHIKS